ncbi:hypothetical protein D3C76_1695960 [compost metagenome]
MSHQIFDVVSNDLDRRHDPTIDVNVLITKQLFRTAYRVAQHTNTQFLQLVPRFLSADDLLTFITHN